MDILGRAPEILDAIERRRNYCTLNDKSQFSHGCIYADVMDTADLIRAMQSELARVQKERDAAVRDIEKIKNNGKTWMCPYCKNFRGALRGVPKCDFYNSVKCENGYTKFEWRGIKEDNNE